MATDKLRCAFCDSVLVGDDMPNGGESSVWLQCVNEKCRHAYNGMHREVWETLLSGNELEAGLSAAINALEFISAGQPNVEACQDAANHALNQIHGATNSYYTQERVNNNLCRVFKNALIEIAEDCIHIDQAYDVAVKALGYKGEEESPEYITMNDFDK